MPRKKPAITVIPGGPADGRPFGEPVPIGYTALLLPLRAEFPAPILPEPPITDAEWAAMVEAIRASSEDVIALPVPASCTDEATLRACADALRVVACALGVGLHFYPRFEGTHRDRSGKEARTEVVPAALMVRRTGP